VDAIDVSNDQLVIVSLSELQYIVAKAAFYKLQSIELSQRVLELLREEFNRRGAA